jgi:hypothetical protein
MVLENKYQMSRDANIYVVRKNLGDLIFKSLKLENVEVNYPDVYAVTNGGLIYRMDETMQVFVFNLKRAWLTIIIDMNVPLDLETMIKLYEIVGQGMEQHPKEAPETFIPPEAPEAIAEILELENPTDRAVTLLLYILRNPIFPVWNQLVAFYAANHIMIGNGVGTLTVPTPFIPRYRECLISDIDTAKQIIFDNFISENCRKNKRTTVSRPHSNLDGDL